jgi:hypothetical protein
MSARRPIDPLAAIEAELQEERAHALGRIARTLEGHLRELHRLRARFAVASDEERHGLKAAYRDARQAAQRYHWYLCVQREALGLRNHDALDAHYRIPAARIDER